MIFFQIIQTHFFQKNQKVVIQFLGFLLIREAFKKKYYLVREIVHIPSDTPTIETVSEY